MGKEIRGYSTLRTGLHIILACKLLTGNLVLCFLCSSCLLKLFTCFALVPLSSALITKFDSTTLLVANLWLLVRHWELITDLTYSTYHHCAIFRFLHRGVTTRTGAPCTVCWGIDKHRISFPSLVISELSYLPLYMLVVVWLVELSGGGVHTLWAATKYGHPGNMHFNLRALPLYIRTRRCSDTQSPQYTWLQLNNPTVLLLVMSSMHTGHAPRGFVGLDEEEEERPEEEGAETTLLAYHLFFGAGGGGGGGGGALIAGASFTTATSWSLKMSKLMLLIWSSSSVFTSTAGICTLSTMVGCSTLGLWGISSMNFLREGEGDR